MIKQSFKFLPLFLLSLTTHAATRFVTPTGAGLMNGISWGNAFPGGSLQAAITASVPGDEVWVQNGTYFTTTGTARNIYFNMVNGVAIYGSFNGNEMAVSQRVFTCGFTSVLSGEINVAGIADNSYHVISNSSLNNTAILDGFTIRDANANFDLTGNDNRSLGGGMLNNAANGGLCSPTIRNCLFTNNTALFGAGIFNHGQNSGNANPVITNCIFAFNTANSGGGGIDNFGYNGNASPVITNCIFYSNVALDRAGGMYCWGGGNGNASPTVLNSVFVNNTAVDGGGIVADRSNFMPGNSGNANPTVRNSIFWGNTASGTGPQFFTIGGATFIATFSAINTTNQNPPHIISGAGTGNLFTAPTFLNMANAAGQDNCWLTNDDGLQLQSGSVGIDVGNNAALPAFDIRNYNRVSNAVVDMGAYEFSSTILPVQLIAFTGKTHTTFNQLTWVTATEASQPLFIVQRSMDGTRFEKIGETKNFENSGGLRQYLFKDDRLSTSKYYYRLRQTDQNGSYSLSHVVMLTNKAHQPTVLVYPNPVLNGATIYFMQPLLLNETFELYNAAGQFIERLLFTGTTGHIDLSGKAAGIYSLVNKKMGVVVKVVKGVE